MPKANSSGSPGGFDLDGVYKLSADAVATQFSSGMCCHYLSLRRISITLSHVANPVAITIIINRPGLWSCHSKCHRENLRIWRKHSWIGGRSICVQSLVGEPFQPHERGVDHCCCVGWSRQRHCECSFSLIMSTSID